MTTTTESPKRSALIRQMVQFIDSLQQVPENIGLWPLTPAEQSQFIQRTLIHARTIWTQPEFMILSSELDLDYAMQEAVQLAAMEKKKRKGSK